MPVPARRVRELAETAGETMIYHRHGGVTHLELHTHDLTEVRDFLCQLLGWRSREVAVGGSSYLALSVSDRMSGGIIECGQEPPSWLPYVRVSDVRMATGRACQLGASVLLAPREGPVGWRSVVTTRRLAISYALLSLWYVVPRLSKRPREAALQPLMWVHAFRMIGGTVLAPGAVGAAVPLLFQRMIGYGDLITAFLALLALVALRARLPLAIALTWLVVVVGMADTVNAIIQSMRYSVFTHALGVNWVIVTTYVPALLVSSALILWQLIRSPALARSEPVTAVRERG